MTRTNMLILGIGIPAALVVLGAIVLAVSFRNPGTSRQTAGTVPAVKPVISDPCAMFSAAQINAALGTDVGAGTETGTKDVPACTWDDSAANPDAPYSFNVTYAGFQDQSFASFMQNPRYAGEYHKTARTIGDESAWLTSGNAADTLETTLLVRKHNYKYQFDFVDQNGVDATTQAKLLNLVEPVFK